MSLGKWGLLLCWGWREATIQALTLGMGRCATDWEHVDSTASLVLYTSKPVRWCCTFLDSLVRLTRWLRLGTMFCSRWTYELISLPGRISSACMALLFGTPNQAILCTEFLGQVRTSVFFFFLKIGKDMGCALCSSATLIRGVRWPMQLPVCSG